MGNPARPGQWPGHYRSRDCQSRIARLVGNEGTNGSPGRGDWFSRRQRGRNDRDGAHPAKGKACSEERTCMIRALIVDDHEIVRRGLKEVLEDEFSELETGEAENSRAALELIMAQDWEIVLLDINIPGRNGLEVLSEIKRLRPSIPVLVVSAYAEEEFAIRSLKLGASGYLNKSSASGEVAAAARKVMAGGKYV